jgi:hypothetical protein
MQGPQHLFRVLNEMVFVLLGGMLMWIAGTGRYFFNPRGMAWFLISGLAIVLGLMSLLTRSGESSRVGAYVRGGSLIVVGLVMISMAWAPYRLVVWLLMFAGIVLVLRGLIGSVMSLRFSARSGIPAR